MRFLLVINSGYKKRKIKSFRLQERAPEGLDRKTYILARYFLLDEKCCLKE